MSRKRLHIINLIVLFFLCNNLLKAQSNWSEWQKGIIYLSNGKEFEGNILYEDNDEIVQYLDVADKVKTFSAFEIDSFKVEGNKYSKSYHKFYWNRENEFFKKVPLFFLKFYDGNLKLLSKERKILVSDDFNTPLSVTANPMAIPFPMYYETTTFDYFFCDENGDIKLIKDGKKFFIKKYPEYKSEIKKAFQKARRSERQKYIAVIRFLEKEIKT